ncbi:MAG TPA: ferritin family protein [Candidatus Rifleibacterium sp.]|nr:ferritin family protein [Candidatus Rifleibacterium sp.]HPT48015.1 ferritin family protein [Candidatus Rifleibacterium sp.]
MQLVLNTVDVLQASVMLEQRGAEFYAKAASQSSGRERELLDQLSGMEAGHAKMFADLLAAYQGAVEVRQETVSEEATAFLQALTSDRIISTECQIEKGDTYPEILEKAMLIEKNSVFFYTSVKYSLLAGMPAGTVDRLIGEEIGHFKALSDALLAWRSRHK